MLFNCSNFSLHSLESNCPDLIEGYMLLISHQGNSPWQVLPLINVFCSTRILLRVRVVAKYKVSIATFFHSRARAGSAADIYCSRKHTGPVQILIHTCDIKCRVIKVYCCTWKTVARMGSWWSSAGGNTSKSTLPFGITKVIFRPNLLFMKDSNVL